jgi:hypothetical protein
VLFHQKVPSTGAIGSPIDYDGGTKIKNAEDEPFDFPSPAIINNE